MTILMQCSHRYKDTSMYNWSLSPVNMCIVVWGSLVLSRHVCCIDYKYVICFFRSDQVFFLCFSLKIFRILKYMKYFLYILLCNIYLYIYYILYTLYLPLGYIVQMIEISINIFNNKKYILIDSLTYNYHTWNNEQYTIYTHIFYFFYKFTKL